MSGPGLSPYRRVVAVVTALHAMVGVAVAVTRPGPLLSRDDVANLAISRWVATGDATVLPEQPPYGFLLPVLSAPAWWLGLDVDGAHTWTRVVNAGLGAATIPVLVFAGATRMRTEVLPTTVWLELSVGNLESAVAVSLLMVLFAMVVLVAIRWVGERV